MLSAEEAEKRLKEAHRIAKINAIIIPVLPPRSDPTKIKKSVNAVNKK